MKAYYVNIPGVSHPLTAFGYNERSARYAARISFGYGKRLPKGTKLYLKTS